MTEIQPPTKQKKCPQKHCYINKSQAPCSIQTRIPLEKLNTNQVYQLRTVVQWKSGPPSCIRHSSSWARPADSSNQPAAALTSEVYERVKPSSTF